MRRTRKSKRCGQDGVYYDHTSKRIYGNYVLYINVVAQKAPEKFVVSTERDRSELIKHMERLGRFVADDLFPYLQESELLSV